MTSRHAFKVLFPQNIGQEVLCIIQTNHQYPSKNLCQEVTTYHILKLAVRICSNLPQAATAGSTNQLVILLR